MKLPKIRNLLQSNPDNCKTRIIAMNVNAPFFSPISTQYKNPDNCKTRLIATLFSVPRWLSALFWTRLIAMPLWNRGVTGERQPQRDSTCPVLTTGFIFSPLRRRFSAWISSFLGHSLFHARFCTYKSILTRIMAIYSLFSLDIWLNARPG
jgi:hypothetical protein